MYFMTYTEEAREIMERITRRISNYLTRTYPDRNFRVKEVEGDDQTRAFDERLEIYERKPGIFGRFLPKLIAYVENYETKRPKIHSFNEKVMPQKLLEALVTGNTEETMPAFFKRR